MSKKNHKLVKRLKRVIPEIGVDVAEFITGQDDFLETVHDIVTDITDEHETNKKKDKNARLFSLNDLDTLGRVLSVKNAARVDEKFATQTTPFLKFDYINNVWRIFASHSGYGVKRPVNIAIGETINGLTHMADAKFMIVTNVASIIYDDNTKEINDFTLKGAAAP